MRGLFLLMAFSGMLIPTFMASFIGVLLWIWIACGTPHLETFGFTRSFQFNFLIALVTLFLWIFYKKDSRAYKNPALIAIYVFVIIVTISNFTGEAIDHSTQYWTRIVKVLVLVFVIIGIIDNRVRVHACVWVLAISFGYYGSKAGLGTLASGGSYRISGPLNSPIHDNNHTAAAFIFVLPLMNYLRLHSASRLLRWLIVIVMLATLVGIMGTYSRGGFLGLTAMACYFWMRSRGKVRNGIIVCVIAAIGVSFVPQKYFDRLSTIESAAEEDGSFKGRLEAWQAAINIANSRVLGVGPRGYEIPHVFSRYKNPDFEKHAIAMHSIYFEVLGDVGYVGLLTYLIMAFSVWLNILWIIRHTANRPELQWAHDFARMSEISLVGFAVAGAALSMAFFEPMFVTVGLVVCVRVIVTRHLEANLGDSRRPWLANQNAVHAGAGRGAVEGVATRTQS